MTTTAPTVVESDPRGAGYLRAALAWLDVASQACERAARCYEASVDSRAQAHAKAARAHADELAALRLELRTEQAILERLERQRVARGEVAA